jgi:hypothetical protein
MTQDTCPVGSRRLFDAYGNPWDSTPRREQAITNEYHIVENHPLLSPEFYGIQLAESPKRGTLVIKRASDSVTLTEVTAAPSDATQYRVDYEPDATDPDRLGTAYVEFHSSAYNVDPSLSLRVYCAYTGMGSPVKADIINEVQGFHAFFRYFGGDASDGDKVVSVNESWTALPKQYRDLTVNASIIVTPAAGVSRIVVGVARRLTLLNGSTFNFNNGVLRADGRSGLFCGGGGGAGDVWPGSDGVVGALSSGEAGTGGVAPYGNGVDGVNNWGLLHDGTNQLYTHAKSPAIRFATGVRGGNGAQGTTGSPGTGGRPGCCIYMEVKELYVDNTTFFYADGANGTNGTNQSGAGGGGSGGFILIAFKKLVKAGSPTYQANGGVGGISGTGGDGGDGSQGFAGVWRVREAA